MKRSAFCVFAVAVLLASAALSAFAVTSEAATGYSFTRASNPPRTIVKDPSGRVVATFTDGARTVTVAGPARTFREATATAAVTTTAWVRVLPSPFAGTVSTTWLTGALSDVSPDALAVAMQYVAAAPPLFYAAGVQIAGDAGYGPLLADGTREEGSDFNDYVGIPWSYGGTTDPPEPRQLRHLDCSGFVRMVFGFRSGVPLALAPDGVRLPRRSFEMYEAAPGVVTIANAGTRSTRFERLLAGDVVFFDAAMDDGPQLDHVGIYLGRDASGSHRFVSSRKSIDGPTLGDYRGKSVLDGSGLYAMSFRAARRL